MFSSTNWVRVWHESDTLLIGQISVYKLCMEWGEVGVGLVEEEGRVLLGKGKHSYIRKCRLFVAWD